MTARKDAILFALAGVCRKHNKGYCYPTQKHIMYLVKKWNKIEMCRSTVNRLLRELEDEGWFVRIRRHRKGPCGKILFASTLYKLKSKLYKYLGSLKDWLGGFFSVFRVRNFGQYKHLQSEMCAGVGSQGGFFHGSPEEKGRASPVKCFL
jgi:GH43 family beta-xylosidase